jgi:hypothetical protein
MGGASITSISGSSLLPLLAPLQVGDITKWKYADVKAFAKAVSAGGGVNGFPSKEDRLEATQYLTPLLEYASTHPEIKLL